MTTVSSGQTLFVTSGETSSGIVVLSSGTLDIQSGGIAIGATVSFGGHEQVEAGGTASATVVNGGRENLSGSAAGARINGGEQYIYSGGVASGTSVSSFGTQHVSSGGIAIATTLSSFGYQYVSSGGTASSTIVGGNGNEHVLSGGVASGTTIASGGSGFVTSGGTIIDPVISGGRLEIDAGGSLGSGTVRFAGINGRLRIEAESMPDNAISGFASGDIIDLAGVFFTGGGVQLMSGNALQVSENGSSYVLQLAASDNFSGQTFHAAPDGGGGTRLLLGQLASVSSGQTVSNALVTSGNLQEVYGSTVSTTVVNGGMQDVFSGGFASVSIISSGGYQQVESGGFASGTRVLSSGIQGVFGSADATTISNGGRQEVWASATATTINGGEQHLYSDGLAGGVTVSGFGEQHVSSGGLAIDTTLSGFGYQYVSSGGAAIVNTIGNDGYEYVLAGGLAVSATIGSGGQVYVYSGGMASDPVIDGGTLEIYDGGSVDGGITFASVNGTLQIDGTTMPANVISGLEAGDDIILGGVDFVSGGSAALTSGNVLQIVEDGNLYELQLDPGQDFSGLLFSLYSTQFFGQTGIALLTPTFVSSGQTVSNITLGDGDLQLVYGTAVATVISNGGKQDVLSGGLADATTVSSGGDQVVESGGTASDTTVRFGGFQEVNAGGSVLSTTISGGRQDVHGAASGTRVNDGSQYIYAGGVASATTVSGFSDQTISSGGVAVATTLSSFGYQYVESGGVASGTIIGSAGYAYIYSGGTASGTTIGSSGTEYVYSGGTAVDTVINSGGHEYVSSGGTIGHTTVNSGGVLVLGGGAFAALLAQVDNSGGTIELQGALDNTGQILSVGSGTAIGRLLVGSNGTIISGTIADSGAGLQFGSGTLRGVTYQGTIDLSTSSASLRVTSGLVAQGTNGIGSGTVDLTGSRGTLTFAGTQSFDGATVNMGSPAGDTLASQDAGGAAVLTLGPDLTINHAGQLATLSGSQNAGAGIVNQGTISAGLAGGSFGISARSFTNSGTIVVANGDSLGIAASDFGNESGATITVGADSTLAIGAQPLFVDFADLPGNGGSPPNPYRGLVWSTPGFNFDVLNGANELAASGYRTIGNPPGNVAYNGFAEYPVDIRRADGGDFFFQGVDLASAWNASLQVTLTGYLDGRVVGTSTVAVSDLGPTHVSEDWGPIDDLKIIAAGAVKDTVNNFTPSNIFVMDNFSFLLGSGGGQWSNEGSIAVGSGAALHLGGSFGHASLSGIANSGGTVYFDGALANGGQTLSVGSNTALGPAQLNAGGSISGGTVQDNGSGLQFRGGTLDGVTYQGPLDLSSEFESVTIANGLTAQGVNGTGSGTVDLTGRGGALTFVGTQTFDNATVNVGNDTAADTLASQRANGTSAVLTLGPNLTIDQIGRLTALTASGSAGDGIVNEGTIIADVADGAFGISGRSFINSGAISVANGDTLAIGSTDFTNDTEGSLTIGAGSTVAVGYQAVLLDFADLTTQNLANGLALTNPYQGFVWSTPNNGRVFVLNALDQPAASGYRNGSISPDNVVAYNGFANQPVDIHRTDDSTFIFQGVEVAAAWNLSLDVTFTGYLDGQVVGRSTVTVSDHTSTSVNQYWGPIDDLQITAANGVADTANNFTPSNIFVMDNFSFLTSVAGSEWTNEGDVTLAPGSRLIASSVENDSILEATAGSLIQITGPVTGQGELHIDSNSVLDLRGPNSQTVTFNGSNGVLRLGDPEDFTGAIAGLANGDRINLKDVKATAASIVGSTLQIALAEGGTLTYGLTGTTAQAVAIADDGLGGTDIIAGPPQTDHTPATVYSFVTDFTKTNNIQTTLIGQFPTGVFVPDNSFAAPFNIISNASGANFFDGFDRGQGNTLTIDVSIPDAISVYMLMNAYAPVAGQDVATVQFISDAGHTETFTLRAGNDIRDFYQGNFAGTIDGTTTRNAFTVTNTRGGAGTGNVTTGAFGTYVVDEIDFALDPVFAHETLDQIIITDLTNGQFPAPILLGVTVQSFQTVAQLTAVAVTAIDGNSNQTTGTLNAGHTVTFALAMSQAVTVSGTPTLSLNDGGSASYDAAATAALGDPTRLVFNYQVAPTDGDVNSLAVASVNLPNGATIIDGNGNSATLSVVGLSQSGPAINTSIPRVGSIALTAVNGVPGNPGYLHAGDNLALTLTLNEAVTLSGGTPTLIINHGGAATYDAAATAALGDPGKLVFAYTVGTSNETVAQLRVTGFNMNGAVLSDSGDNTGDFGSAQRVVPAVQINQSADPVFQDRTGLGTFTVLGNDHTLDLGVIAEGATITIDLGVLNEVTGPADLISGALQISGSNLFTATGFEDVSNLAAGQADTSLEVTLHATQTGVVSTTITLSPTGHNPGGYSAVLPFETLTILADVQQLPPPVITAPSEITVTGGFTSPVGPISIFEPDATNLLLTVTLSDRFGLLSASGAAGGTITGAGTHELTIAGTLAQVNAALATLTDRDDVRNPDSITVSVSDNRGGAVAQTIAVNVANTLALGGISPIRGSNVGSVTLTLDGANFRTNQDVEVIAEDGTIRPASEVLWANSGELWATFDLTGLASGNYDVTVHDDTQSATLTDAFQVTSGGAGHLAYNIVLPNSIQPGQTGIVTVEYVNYGGTDVVPPILDLSAVGATFQGGTEVAFLAINPDGPGGILQPGTRGSASFEFTALTGAPEFILQAAESSPISIDWEAEKESFRPPYIDQADWNNVWAQFEAQVGNTVSSLLAALSQDATELSQISQLTNDLDTLFQYELLQANGNQAHNYLAGAVDLVAPRLSLARIYDASLWTRDAPGPFGDGWTSNYDISAITDANGNVYIKFPAGIELFNRQADGSFSGQLGDASTLSVTGDGYRLLDASGIVTQFRSDGKLSQISDADGYTITVTWNNGGLLQTVASSAGESITFTSNAFGRIASATDSDGQQVTYTYDTTGARLIGASGPGGAVAYSYNGTTGSATDNVLTAVSNSEGTLQYFQFDAQGRLISQEGGNGTGRTSYTYDSAGRISVTDALGNTSIVLYGADGNVAQVEDSLGRATQLHYDSNGNFTSVVTAGNNLLTYSYDALGNLISYSDPLGGTITASYQPGTHLLTEFTDQLGDTIIYNYDGAGNITGVMYEDDSGTTYQYTIDGLLASSTNARGQTITYTYDSFDQLTRATFGDASSEQYSYDSRGNLTFAQARDGSLTAYTYDDADRLTSVTDLHGRTESYAYDTSGRLVQIIAPDGSATDYSYDSSGRLAELHDGSGNLLVRYGYDISNRLVRADKGNGTSTTYAYNGAGDLTQIVDLAADGNVASSYAYTYDANSLPVSVSTLDGVWSYAYDGLGELTRAVFESTNVAIPDQDLSYVYDAAGNRVSTVLNGAVATYTVNGLSQYVTVDGTAFTYDADGNLVERSKGGDSWTYSYDEENQLTGQIGPDGTLIYRYDALGNRIGMTDDGITTDYVIDPLAVSGLGSIAQVYRAGSSPVARYISGYGLAAVADSSGNVSYFNTDLTGNVTGVSGPDGNLANTYFYLPFGETMQTAGSSDNPFKFGGGFGVVSDANGLNFMRARYYDPITGRFLSRDPIGIEGGSNLYRYVNNSPLAGIDPSGTVVLIAPLLVSAGAGALIAGGLELGTQLTANGGNWNNVDWSSVGWQAAGGGLSGALGAGMAPTGWLLARGAQAAGGLFNNGRTLGKLLSPIAPVLGHIKLRFGWGWEGTALNGSNKLRFSVGDRGTKKVPGDPWHDHFYLPLPGLPNFGKKPLESALEQAAFGGAGILGGFGGGGWGGGGSVSGEPHLTTFNGLHYDFQAKGEFLVAKSTQAGNSFEVQARLAPWGNSNAVSAMTMLAAQVGTDRVSFGIDRPDTAWINGVPAPLSSTNTIINLNGGQLIALGPNTWQLTWNTGQSLLVSNSGSFLNVDISLGPNDGPGSIKGLLGSAAGQATDFRLADGTVLPQPLSSDDLYGIFANAWRVTDATSLLDYESGETTATFTDVNFPGGVISLADLPPDLVERARALAAAAGITDPNIANDAILDYLVTGDLTFITAAANQAQLRGQLGITTTQAQVTPSAPPPLAVGIGASQSSVTESDGGTTAVTFTVYLTRTTTLTTTVNYAVVAPGIGYLDAADFGGTLPSGQLIIPAGGRSVEFAINLPPDALGTDPLENLQVEISTPNGEPLFASKAHTTIINSQPVAGAAPAPLLVELATAGTLTHNGNAYTLDLGTLVFGQSLLIPFALINDADAPADELGGSISVNGSGFTVTGTGAFAPIAAGQSYQGLGIRPDTTSIGAHSATITFALQDVNLTGYLAALPDLTLTITGDVMAPADATVNTPSVIDFGAVRTGMSAVEAVSITNTAIAPAASLDVFLSSLNGGAIVTGSISDLAPGETDDTHLSVGIQTNVVGQTSGIATIKLQSDAGNGNTAPLFSQQVQVFGTVYRIATPDAEPIIEIVHVGDPGTAPLSVFNLSPADGWSEYLLASVAGTTGEITASGTTGAIAPEGSDSSAITVTWSTDDPGFLSGDVLLAIATDGTGVNGLAPLALGTLEVPVDIAVLNYADSDLAAGGVGTFRQVGDNFYLDFGTIPQGVGDITDEIGVLNDAKVLADLLSGVFTGVPTGGGVNVALRFSGFGPVSGIGAEGGVLAGTVTLDTSHAGFYSAVIGFDPTGSNPSGYSAALPHQNLFITATVVDDGSGGPGSYYLKKKDPPDGDGWGDVHLTTFNGLHYDFQAVGEFVLTRSTQAGDLFEIQARMAPWGGSSTVSVMTMVGAQVGSDRVTFAIDRPNTVWVNGQPTTSTFLDLDGGTLIQLAPGVFQLAWDTGETMKVTKDSSYLNVNVSLGPDDGPGSVAGLLGAYEGRENEFQLADGTVLPQPLSSSDLYGVFADAWRVTDDSSLLDYGAGQHTADFTDAGFPRNAVSLADLPADLVEEAAQRAAAAGIIDPNVAAAAQLDFLATGDASFLTGAANAQQLRLTASAGVTQSGPPAPALGVAPAVSSIVASDTQATAVTFDVYLTSSAAVDTVVNYSVVSGGVFDAAAFGGTLPSGPLTIAAGETSGQFTINVPQSALGSQPSEQLEVQISSPGGTAVFASTAQTTVINDDVLPGAPPMATLAKLTQLGTLTHNGNAYTLDLGTLVQGDMVSKLQFAVINAANAPADQLGAIISAAGSGFMVLGTGPLSPIEAGQSFDRLYVVVNTSTLGPHSETITFTLQDINPSGYSAALSPLTLTITNTVVAPAAPTLNTPATIDFGAVRLDTLQTQAISITNSAIAPAAALDVALFLNGGALGTGTIDQLAPGATDDTSLTVGLDTSVAGPVSGQVTLDLQSDPGNDNIALLPSQDIDVSGTVYRVGAAFIPAIIAHVGDPTAQSLAITNDVPNDGYSENLVAFVATTTGAVGASGNTGAIAPQATSNAIALTYSTAAAGSIGSVTLDLMTDGTGINGLGALALGQQTVSITVNNYADPDFEQISGGGTLSQNGNAYSLGMGRFARGLGPVTVQLGMRNEADGPADVLAGSYTLSGDSAFTNTGFVSFSDLGAGQTDTGPTVALDTSQVGRFQQIITLHSAGSNASGYSGALADLTLTIYGTVTAGVKINSELSGDSVSDILWRNDASGDVGYYRIVNNANAGWFSLGLSSTAYKVVGLGDVNGDGTSDILWRNDATGDTGFYAIESGGNAGWHSIGASSTEYAVAGIGDFNSDGFFDILWRNDATGDTGFYAIENGVNTGWHSLGGSSTDYAVRGVGDFNGDGTDDILWRNEASGDTGFYELNSDGSLEGWHSLGGSSTAYRVAGVGDFTGDGTDDILWRNEATGDLGFYEMVNGVNAGWHHIGGSSTAYSVVAIGDYTGEGTSDILFRNNGTGDTGFYQMSNGALAGWQGLGASSTAYGVVDSQGQQDAAAGGAASGQFGLTANFSNGDALANSDAAKSAVCLDSLPDELASLIEQIKSALPEEAVDRIDALVDKIRSLIDRTLPAGDFAGRGLPAISGFASGLGTLDEFAFGCGGGRVPEGWDTGATADAMGAVGDFIFDTGFKVGAATWDPTAIGRADPNGLTKLQNAGSLFSSELRVG